MWTVRDGKGENPRKFKTYHEALTDAAKQLERRGGAICVQLESGEKVYYKVPRRTWWRSMLWWLAKRRV